MDLRHSSLCFRKYYTGENTINNVELATMRFLRKTKCFLKNNAFIKLRVNNGGASVVAFKTLLL